MLDRCSKYLSTDEKNLKNPPVNKKKNIIMLSYNNGRQPGTDLLCEAPELEHVGLDLPPEGEGLQRVLELLVVPVGQAST